MHRALNLPRGVAILQVGSNSPAMRANLQPFRRGSQRGEIIAGDVITAVDGDAVGSLDDMLTLLERRQPGDTVTLTVWRAGQTRRQPVQLGSSD